MQVKLALTGQGRAEKTQVEFMVKGSGAYSVLKYESGVHRVAERSRYCGDQSAFLIVSGIWGAIDKV